jgi:hypothetical protein
LGMPMPWSRILTVTVPSACSQPILIEMCECANVQMIF